MLPAEHNAGMVSKSWTDGGAYFDSVADLYDARRPEFPPEVFAELAPHTRLTASSTVLEVGAGTGQATVRLAELGVSVVALEPGAALAERAARRLAAFDNIELVQSTFEDWDPHGRRFDVVLAASCWHWLDPQRRWRKPMSCSRTRDGSHCWAMS